MATRPEQMPPKRQRRKWVPQRTCVGCRTQAAKRELLRLVRTPDGDVEYDPTQKAAGRGAYVCRSKECLDMAARSGALARSLKVAVAAEVLQGLADIIDE